MDYRPTGLGRHPDIKAGRALLGSNDNSTTENWCTPMNDNTPNSTTADAFDATPAGEPDNLLDLLAATPPVVEADGDAADESDAVLTLTERFERFHEANPAVYKTLRWLARDWQRRTGGRKIGFPALYERARWELGLRTDDTTYLINNSYRPFFSRLLMTQEPDLKGMFETRRAPEADEWIAGRTDLGRAA
ncbi:hypothetical protein OHQ88_10660 [Micromonospora zamorensis]|uniref:hypothetical protein n=1 Tax=Micromonospora zamorensis TaxID=709883 RepID=UPI002E1BA9A8